MNIEGVRAFIAVAEEGQFQGAAGRLGISQQAVSKRLAALESELGVRLFNRAVGGAKVTLDGQAFLRHARELIRAEERAANSVRPEGRALRVDVLTFRTAPANLMRSFHRVHPDIALDLVTIGESARVAVAAIEKGAIDASFRAVGSAASQLPAGIKAIPAIDDRHQLLVGPRHPLARARLLTPTDLQGQRIWMPGMLAGSEWDLYYDHMAEAFGLSIERVGPFFGIEHLMDVLAESSSIANLAGEGTRYTWPEQHDLRRIPIQQPAPVYPHALVFDTRRRHAGLEALIDFVASQRPETKDADLWRPAWTVPA